MIRTEEGDLPVEALQPGMMVMTADHGPQELRWVGAQLIDAATMTANPQLRPIRIRAGALGCGLPQRDLIVSPQHRVLVRSRIAQKIFGATEILVAAKQLLQIDGIDIADDLHEVEYVHFLFDRHEVVFSEGAQTESLYTGTEALKAVGEAARDEIFAIFPELRDTETAEMPQGARILASGRQGRKLAVRHAQHNKALVE
ncbi:hemolysin [Paracoccus limosus]|uniref:Hemolysin n=1 Tax=Paracoccus limosus TaxID=913252 RepID=A0A844H463_9RHOB|nr:hemolysin [Paracoccus limosus]